MKYEITLTIYVESDSAEQAEKDAIKILDDCEFNYREDSSGIEIKELD